MLSYYVFSRSHYWGKPSSGSTSTKTNTIHGAYARLLGKIAIFQQQNDELFTEAWEKFQNYIEDCPHHGIEEWLLMQTFYHGLISSTHQSVDAAGRGAFLSLKLSDAKAHIEKMA